MKRLLALTASAIAGALGTIAVATPAQAHHNTLVGEGICQDNGQYEVTWKITNAGNWDERIARITKLEPSVNTPLTPVAPTKSFGVGSDIAPNATIVGRQMVPTASAKLTIDAQWFEKDGVTPAKDGNGKPITDPRWNKAIFDVATCQPTPNPTATFLNNCDGTVKVHLVNPTGRELEFTVATEGWSEKKKVAAKDKADVVVPADKADKAITVAVGKDTIGKGGPWARPAECPTPSALGESTCDKFTLKLTNPPGGQATKANVVYGTQEKKDIALAPGSTVPVELTPSSTGEAIVTFAHWENLTVKVKYQKPTNCDTLPKTGASTGTYIASGTGIALLGGVVFLFARRRMVKLRRMAA